MTSRDSESIRGVPPLFKTPLTRLSPGPIDFDAIIRARGSLRPVEVLRPVDLVNLTFSFRNLHLVGKRGIAPRLVRSARNRPAYLIVGFGSQHVTELATFENADGLELDPDDPDYGKGDETLAAPPVFASIAGSSRVVLKVLDEEIPFTTEGLLGAIGMLDLSVAAHALPPVVRRRIVFADVMASDLVDLGKAYTKANGPRWIMPKDAERRIEVGEGATAVVSQIIAVGRARATGAALEYRFGTDAAVDALQASSLGGRLDVDDRIDVTRIIPIDTPPPLPKPPGETHTALELPWRLIISPNKHGAFAHSSEPVQHNGRFELWHSRLGVRAVDKDGRPILDEERRPMVDEQSADAKTIRATWARDFDVLPDLGQPAFEFDPTPDGSSFPKADGGQDRPSVRMALNSRDRMMLVHQTSNFHLKRGPSDWVPEAVPTNRLMLAALGGWLDSRVRFHTRPDNLTIEEWKHRAALGRDHEVKVVYAGFLLPFGHKASLVKITERRLADGPGGTAAYLFQRMFVVVREPEKRFRNDSRALNDGRRPDLVMPLGTVRILTMVTPLLDSPTDIDTNGASGHFFHPAVAGSRFEFKMLATDLDGNILEFSAPLLFMEEGHNNAAGDPSPLNDAIDAYNTKDLVDRQFDLRGQRMAFADSASVDDTALATHSLRFEVATAPHIEARPQDEPRFVPVLEEARAVVPAMSALAGSAAPIRVAYPEHFAEQGFADNAAEVFLMVKGDAPLDFAGQSDRSGGLVTPSLKVKGLSRVTGPIGGDLKNAISDAANYDVGDFFTGISAKLFGLIPLSQLFKATGFSPDRVPSFITQTLDVATTLKQNVERLRNSAEAEAGVLGAAGVQLKDDVDALLADLADLSSDPNSATDQISDDLDTIAGDLDPFIAAVDGATSLPETQRRQLSGIARLVQDQLANAAAITAAVQALVQFAQGLKLPEVVTARLDWSTEIDPWPSSGSGAIFQPLDPQTHAPSMGKITLAVEVQAPTSAGTQPSALVSCSLTPFDLRLIGAATFLILHFETIEFSLVTGKKPDVNVRLRESNGIEFAGPLEFVNTLKDIIPFDGFSDPPYLDVAPEGIKAGFDLPIPDVAVGVFALTNISLGAHFIVPFIDESIETAFAFSTRENPFRLQVSLFAGGGFFGVTITPKRVRVLEAAFEFGAAIAVNFGVASGGVSVMAGIYFRLEFDGGEETAQLTGYFRMRGEVDVLGLISACIELYLELTYETASGKAVGRARITVEISVLFLSFSVSISCEKKFAGANDDPTFVEVMGLPPSAPAGAPRPWDLYCHAFAMD